MHIHFSNYKNLCNSNGLIQFMQSVSRDFVLKYHSFSFMRGFVSKNKKIKTYVITIFYKYYFYFIFKFITTVQVFLFKMLSCKVYINYILLMAYAIFKHLMHLC